MGGPVTDREEFGVESFKAAVEEHKEDPWGKKPGNSCFAFLGLVILVLVAASAIWRLLS